MSVLVPNHNWISPSSLRIGTARERYQIASAITAAASTILPIDV